MNRLFKRLHAGETVPFNDPDYGEIQAGVARTMMLLAKLNASADYGQMRHWLSQLIGTPVHESTRVLTPLHTNYGEFIEIGRNVFINHDCSFLALGRITIEDDVLIGPKVCLTTEGHPLAPSERKALHVKPIVVKRNAWIGAGATILPGVTIGENAVVAAGAVVSKDVLANTVVAGVPAKVIKYLEQCRGGLHWQF